MSSLPKLAKLDRVWLKTDAHLDERWVQDQIAREPSIVGLGDVVLRDKERPQPHAGRLDLLLQDDESKRRFEMEIQLGRTDETHIIRTIEYWDIERKRYPQYEHCAVIVAEEITARFLNVIGLFNGHIPLIALQLSAFRVGADVALVFTKVLDEVRVGPCRRGRRGARGYGSSILGGAGFKGDGVARGPSLAGGACVRTQTRAQVQQALRWPRSGWAAEQLRDLSSEAKGAEHGGAHTAESRN